MQGKKSLKQHPKECRYKEKCRRRTNCLYKHNTTLESDKSKEILQLENQNQKLLKEIEVIKHRLKETEDKALEFEKHLKSAKDVAKAFKRSAETLIVDNTSMKHEIENLKAYTSGKEHAHQSHEQDGSSIDFKCDQCDFICNSKQNLRSHVDRKHKKSDKNTESNNMPVLEMRGRCDFECEGEEFFLQHMLRMHKNDLELDKFMLVST